MPRANLTSAIILTINVFLFLLEMVVNSRVTNAPLMNSFTGISGPALALMGAKLPAHMMSGQMWRLVTAGFLHGGIVHLGMNSYVLFSLVAEVEQFYGTARLIVAYIVSTVVGFWLSTMFSASVSAGASAAAFGLIGIMLAMALRRRSDPLAQLVKQHYTQWLVFSLVLSFFPGIDMAAHIGGAAGGFVVGAIAGLPGLPNTPKEILWRVLAGIAVLGTLLCFVLDYIDYQALIRQF